MIFLTVGHQMHFDRLVKMVDGWAAANPGKEIFGQIADGQYLPKNFQYQRFLAPAEYDDLLKSCTAIVSHAGTGTILQALHLNKPLLVFPRLSALGETRNDHQIGTARYFVSKDMILVAEDEVDFANKINDLASFQPGGTVNASAPPELLNKIRKFILGA